MNSDWTWRVVFTLIIVGFLLLGLKDYVDSQSEAGVLELVVWNQPPDSQPLEKELWLETAKGFENDYYAKTKIRVKIKPISREYIQTQFVTVMAGGKGPDVVHVWVGALATLRSEERRVGKEC